MNRNSAALVRVLEGNEAMMAYWNQQTGLEMNGKYERPPVGPGAIGWTAFAVIVIAVAFGMVLRGCMS